MAESHGHAAVIESSVDGVSYAEIVGEDSFARAASRTVLETTHFADVTAHKIKHVGIRDGSVDVGGFLYFAPATFVVDVGTSRILRRMRDAGTLHVRTKLDGSGGTYRGASGLVTAFSLSAEVDGSVKWSAKVQLSGSTWA